MHLIGENNKRLSKSQRELAGFVLLTRAFCKRLGGATSFSKEEMDDVLGGELKVQAKPDGTVEVSYK